MQGADALAIVTEWQEFRSPDFDYIKRALKTPVIFDGRNLYDPLHMARAGFSYYADRPGQAVCSGRIMSTLIPVILSGGAGTRLWPLSREMYPKQLLALTGKRTMLQETAARLAGIAGAAAAHHRVQRGASLHGRRTDSRAGPKGVRHSARARRAATPPRRSRWRR